MHNSDALRDGAEAVAAEAFKHALAGGHIQDLYRLPQRCAARAALAQQAAASGDAFEGLTLDQVKANLSLLKEDDLRGLVVSLLIQQRIAERAFAATQPA